jgi:hypothetical protein
VPPPPAIQAIDPNAPPPEQTYLTPNPATGLPDQGVPPRSLSDMVSPPAQRIGQAVLEPFTEPVLTPHGREVFGASTPYVEAAGHLLLAPLQVPGAVIRGGQQALIELGAPRDIAALPEAFPHEVPGVAHYQATAEAFREAMHEAANRPPIITPTPTPETPPAPREALPAPGVKPGEGETPKPPAPNRPLLCQCLSQCLSQCLG